MFLNPRLREFVIAYYDNLIYEVTHRKQYQPSTIQLVIVINIDVGEHLLIEALLGWMSVYFANEVLQSVILFLFAA